MHVNQLFDQHVILGSFFLILIHVFWVLVVFSTCENCLLILLGLCILVCMPLPVCQCLRWCTDHGTIYKWNIFHKHIFFPSLPLVSYSQLFPTLTHPSTHSPTHTPTKIGNPRSNCDVRNFNKVDFFTNRRTPKSNFEVVNFNKEEVWLSSCWKSSVTFLSWWAFWKQRTFFSCSLIWILITYHYYWNCAFWVGCEINKCGK